MKDDKSIQALLDTKTLISPKKMALLEKYRDQVKEENKALQLSLFKKGSSSKVGTGAAVNLSDDPYPEFPTSSSTNQHNDLAREWQAMRFKSRKQGPGPRGDRFVDEVAIDVDLDAWSSSLKTAKASTSRAATTGMDDLDIENIYEGSKADRTSGVAPTTPTSRPSQPRDDSDEKLSQKREQLMKSAVAGSLTKAKSKFKSKSTTKES